MTKPLTASHAPAHRPAPHRAGNVGPLLRLQMLRDRDAVEFRSPLAADMATRNLTPFHDPVAREQENASLAPAVKAAAAIWPAS